MTSDEVYKLIEANGLTLHGDIEHFAALVEEHVYAKQLELPEPRLTGKFSLTAGLFKCSGCTGTWINRKTAQQHSCKDYQ